MLPSQVMIPPLNTVIAPRGISPAVVVVSSNNRSQPIAFEFGVEPDPGGRNDMSGSSGSNSGAMSGGPTAASGLGTLCNGGGGGAMAYMEGAVTSRQVMDCVRHVYLGKRPYAVKQCTRCCAMTLPVANNTKTGIMNKMWDKKWFKNCPCGGPWKLACLDD